MKPVKLIAIILALVFILASHILYAWDNETTHPNLSELAARNSKLGSSQIYLANLGFVKGIDDSINGKEIFKWVRDGAFYEDAGSLWNAVTATARYKNHFHDPLKTWPWTDAGLSDMQTGESLITWAQNGAGQQSFPEHNWSWSKVREYYYFALTGIDFTGLVVAPDQSTKNVYFAWMFRGLGHQMHLIQDASQPNHVRNDTHLWKNGQVEFLNIEPWAEANSSLINAYAATPQFPEAPLNVSYTGLVPITQLVDTDEYDGTTPSTSLEQGLAEYTNANFASEHTIFAEQKPVGDIHYYPYPRTTSTDIQTYINQDKLPETKTEEDGVGDLGFWIAKTGDGEKYRYFVKPTYLTNFLTGNSLYYKTFYQDKYCYEDSTRLLIPRTVGYSAALINYFFRGTIAITLPDNGTYAITDPNGGFNKIHLKAKNATPNEDMTQSTTDLQLVVKYKLAQSDPFQNAPVATDDDFTYIVASEKNHRTTLPNDPVELIFDLPNPIPLRATNLYLQVVYKGRLGNEDDAIAVGFKDISEPTPIDMINNMDHVCVNTNYMIAGSQEAIDAVDSIANGGNGDGFNAEWDVYPHEIVNDYMAFSPDGAVRTASSASYDVKFSNIPPGGYGRVFVLSDYSFNVSSKLEMHNTDSRDIWPEWQETKPSPGLGLKNQTDMIDGVSKRTSPGMSTERGLKRWSSINYVNGAYPPVPPDIEIPSWATLGEYPFGFMCTTKYAQPNLKGPVAAVIP